MTVKRVNIQLPEELHTRAKIIAVLKGTTMNDYLAEILAEGIKRDKRVLEKIPR